MPPFEEETTRFLDAWMKVRQIEGGLDKAAEHSLEPLMPIDHSRQHPIVHRVNPVGSQVAVA
jgi:hypothetical protein